MCCMSPTDGAHLVSDTLTVFHLHKTHMGTGINAWLCMATHVGWCMVIHVGPCMRIQVVRWCTRIHVIRTELTQNGHGPWSVRPCFWRGSFYSFNFKGSCAGALLAPVRVAATVNRGPRRSFLLCVASGRCGRRARIAQPYRRVLVGGGCGDTLLGVCAFDCELPSLYVHES